MRCFGQLLLLVDYVGRLIANLLIGLSLGGAVYLR